MQQQLALDGGRALIKRASFNGGAPDSISKSVKRGKHRDNFFEDSEKGSVKKKKNSEEGVLGKYKREKIKIERRVSEIGMKLQN